MRNMKSRLSASVLYLAVPAIVAALGCATEARDDKKVIIIGIDGMDHRLLEQFIAEDRMPNFERLAADGDFTPLQTSMPPLSPVAWSTFITGMDPGGHGTYDFLHRDPDTYAPVESIYRVVPPGRSVELGSWVIPLSGGGYELLRKGRAFWELLDDEGVPTTIFRMPVNFPPVETSGRSLSGMGTPDILGTHGFFSFYTNDPPDDADEISGGAVYLVDVIDHRVTEKLRGPPNAFRRLPKTKTATAPRAGVSQSAAVEYENPALTVDFEVFLDADAPTAKLVVQDHEFVLNEGEWSDWIQVDFAMIPYVASISAVGRFYLQQVRPSFKLYVTPLQVSLENPAMPISTPERWAGEIYEALGHGYTQELPEDTSAVTAGIFSGQEFWEQSQFVYQERRRALDYLLDSFKQEEAGLLFFYFSSVDQGSHMLYHYMDEAHPLFTPEEEPLREGIRTLYEEMDEAVGRVLQDIDEDTTLIVMSDHGFSPFYRGVNLNTWLLEKGYVTLKDPSIQGQLPLFLNVDWSATKAYAAGLNGLYVNLEGREQHGVVSTGEEYEQLLDRLEEDLLAMRDDRNDRQAVTLVLRPDRDLEGDHPASGPDLIVGYNWGYRVSWDSPLGEFPRDVFVDNDEPWSGDHAIDYRLVPGILLTNQRITLENPALYDLTVAVLDEFGVSPLPEMIGRDALAPKE